MRIYEINSRIHGSNFEQVTNEELTKLSKLGFTSIWMMGVWQISKGARSISKLIAEDFEGSPYAIPNYKISNALGGRKQFASLVEHAHALNLSVIVDFVSNHMALDTNWIKKNPNFFIRNDIKVRKQNTGDFFLHESGEVIAFGRDPYFPPWHDTAQLDYSNKKLRERMIKVLKRISCMADGVRCDMAMLILRDYIRQHWYPLASEDWFNSHMPKEFWVQAVKEVKAVRPDFTFIAEVYWDKEPELLQQGFDLVYEKKLYDGLMVGNVELVTSRLLRSKELLEKSLYFIENHDEERAAAVFTRERNLASAALILSIPGSVLIHEGQMEGRRERLPVQRIRPLTDEQDDLELKAAYEQLLTITKDDVFSKGEFQLFEDDAEGTVSFMRYTNKRVIAYVGQVADPWHPFSSIPLNITKLAETLGAHSQMRITNLINAQSKIVEEKSGSFYLQLSELGVLQDSKFCLLEASID